MASEQPMHFGEGKAKLFPLSENVFMPGKSSVQVEPEMSDIIWLGKLNIVDMNQWAGHIARSKGDMGLLGFI
jgi:hypothetical protein